MTGSPAFPAGSKVMGGTGNNEFSPEATYTREQAYLTVLRLYNGAEGDRLPVL